MKIYTRVVHEWKDGKPVVTESDSFEYTGSVARCDFFTSLPVITQAILGGVGASIVGSVLQGEPSVPAAPTPEKPTAMPDPLAQQKQAKRKAALMQSQQMTRASTVLTGDSDKLGG